MPAELSFSLLGPQLRPFRNALAGLHKIGAELLLEALPAQLNLRAINTSRSACFSVIFAANFFETYDVRPSDEASAGLQAAVLIKQLSAVFRTQRVNRITFTVDSEALVASLDCDNGLRKTYRLPCTDGEMVVATVDRDNMAIRVTVRADEMNRLLSSFQATLLETSIIARSGRIGGRDVRFVSYIDPTKGHAERHVHTELDLSSDVLLAFSNNSNAASDATFNVRDFKAMVALCEVMHFHVAISFDCAGQPMVVSPEPTGENGLEEFMKAELVLATLMDSQLTLFADEAPHQSVLGGAPPPSTGRIRTPSSAPATAPRNAPSGVANAEGRSTPQTARRDLNSAMRRAYNDSSEGSVPPVGRQCAVEALRQSGSAAAASPRSGGSAALQGDYLLQGGTNIQSDSLQQQQQQQQQADLVPHRHQSSFDEQQSAPLIDSKGRQSRSQHLPPDPSTAQSSPMDGYNHLGAPQGGPRGDAQDDDDSDGALDDYASLQPPQAAWQHQGGPPARGSVSAYDEPPPLRRPTDAYDEFEDQDGQEEEEVPGTPPE